MPYPARTNSIAIFGVIVLLTAAVRAQDPGDDPAEHRESAPVRIYHSNIPVSELASVLKQVVGRRDVSFIAEPINNVLIVRGAEADVQGLDELVERLNQPAQAISFSFTVLEVDGAGDIQDVDPDQLLDELSEDGRATQIRRIRLMSLENQLAQVQLGEQRPVVAGASFGRGGDRINTFQQQDLGTILSLTARVGEDGLIVTELSFEMSRLDESIDVTESAGDVVPPTMRTVTLRTTVSVPDGESVLLTDFDSQDSPADTRLIGVVTATTSRRNAAAVLPDSDERLTLAANRYFGILDKDDDGALSSEEWEASVRIRGMFERDGLDLSHPMSAEEFVQNYVRLSE